MVHKEVVAAPLAVTPEDLISRWDDLRGMSRRVNKGENITVKYEGGKAKFLQSRCVAHASANLVGREEYGGTVISVASPPLGSPEPQAPVGR